MVFHEIVSQTVHLDVHMVPPSAEHDLHRLVTSGMAQRPMVVPEDFGASPFAELTLALPSSWPMSQESFEDEGAYWPLRLLKVLGRLPHEYGTFLWHGHTIPNGDPAEPYAGSTELCCALIVPPLIAPPEFDVIETTDGRKVTVLGVLPIYEAEMQFKLERGLDALLTLFEEHEVGDLIEPNRPSVVPRKRGLFRR